MSGEMADLLLDNPDVLRQVFFYLTIPDLGRVATICRLWNEVVTATSGGGAAEDDLWRAAWQVRWWTPLPEENADDDYKNTTVVSRSSRDAVCGRVQYEQLQAHDLARAQFEDSCHLTPWFLWKNESTVLSMTRLAGTQGTNYGWLVTVHKNGQAKAWQLPVAHSRTWGTEIPMPLVSTKLISVTEMDNNRVLLANVNDFLGVVQFSVVQGANNGDEVTATLVQKFEPHPRIITCLRTNKSVVVTVCGDVMRIFPIRNSPKNNEPTQEAQDEQPLHSTTDMTTTRASQFLQGTTPGVNINQIQFASQKDTLLSAAADGTVCWWNYKTGVCLRAWCMDVLPGGATLLGCNANCVAVQGENLNASWVSILRLRNINNGQEEIQRFTTTGDAQRIQAVSLYEDCLVLATKDGHVKEYNIDTGACCSQTQGGSRGSCPISIHHLGRNTLCLLEDRSQRLVVLERQTATDDTTLASSSEVWNSTRSIPFNMMAKDMYYDADFRTLFVSSKATWSEFFHSKMNKKQTKFPTRDSLVKRNCRFTHVFP